MQRRDFLSGLAMASATWAVKGEGQAERTTDHRPATRLTQAAGPQRPVMVSSLNGLQALNRAYAIVARGGDTLDGALFALRAQEDDPNDDSVGLGGLPNEEGEVELDACCMHGPTRRAGAVAAVRNIRNVSSVARLVMERTDHLLLVGEGAQRFAVAHGFPKENLLTERSRKIWLLWKESMSDQDSWGPGLSSPEWKPPISAPPPPEPPRALEERIRELRELAAEIGIEPRFYRQAIERVLFPPAGTIHVSVVNEKGEISGATSTSGLAWKIPGRVGDSAIIGAGCFTDQDAGSAGSTGRGEENLKVCGAHTIVENLRRGMSPQEAGLDALQRVARNYNHDMTRLRFISLAYYVLRKDGAYAGVSLWGNSAEGKPRRFAVHDGNGPARAENLVPLLQGTPIEWPPTPKLAK